MATSATTAYQQSVAQQNALTESYQNQLNEASARFESQRSEFERIQNNRRQGTQTRATTQKVQAIRSDLEKKQVALENLNNEANTAIASQNKITQSLLEKAQAQQARENALIAEFEEARKRGKPASKEAKAFIEQLLREQGFTQQQLNQQSVVGGPPRKKVLVGTYSTLQGGVGGVPLESSVTGGIIYGEVNPPKQYQLNFSPSLPAASFEFTPKINNTQAVYTDSDITKIDSVLRQQYSQEQFFRRNKIDSRLNVPNSPQINPTQERITNTSPKIDFSQEISFSYNPSVDIRDNLVQDSKSTRRIIEKGSTLKSDKNIEKKTGTTTSFTNPFDLQKALEGTRDFLAPEIPLGIGKDKVSAKKVRIFFPGIGIAGALEFGGAGFLSGGLRETTIKGATKVSKTLEFGPTKTIIAENAASIGLDIATFGFSGKGVKSLTEYSSKNIVIETSKKFKYDKAIIFQKTGDVGGSSGSTIGEVSGIYTVKRSLPFDLQNRIPELFSTGGAPYQFFTRGQVKTAINNILTTRIGVTRSFSFNYELQPLQLPQQNPEKFTERNFLNLAENPSKDFTFLDFKKAEPFIDSKIHKSKVDLVSQGEILRSEINTGNQVSTKYQSNTSNKEFSLGERYYVVKETGYITFGGPTFKERPTYFGRKIVPEKNRPFRPRKNIVQTNFPETTIAYGSTQIQTTSAITEFGVINNEKSFTELKTISSNEALILDRKKDEFIRLLNGSEVKPTEQIVATIREFTSRKGTISNIGGSGFIVKVDNPLTGKFSGYNFKELEDILVKLESEKEIGLFYKKPTSKKLTPKEEDRLNYLRKIEKNLGVSDIGSKPDSKNALLKKQLEDELNTLELKKANYNSNKFQKIIIYDPKSNYEINLGRYSQSVSKTSKEGGAFNDLEIGKSTSRVRGKINGVKYEIVESSIITGKEGSVLDISSKRYKNDKALEKLRQERDVESLLEKNPVQRLLEEKGLFPNSENLVLKAREQQFPLRTIVPNPEDSIQLLRPETISKPSIESISKRIESKIGIQKVDAIPIIKTEIPKSTGIQKSGLLESKPKPSGTPFIIESQQEGYFSQFKPKPLGMFNQRKANPFGGKRESFFPKLSNRSSKLDSVYNSSDSVQVKPVEVVEKNVPKFSPVLSQKSILASELVAKESTSLSNTLSRLKPLVLNKSKSKQEKISLTRTNTKSLSKEVTLPVTKTISNPITQSLTKTITTPITVPQTSTIIIPITSTITRTITIPITVPITTTITNTITSPLVSPISLFLLNKGKTGDIGKPERRDLKPVKSSGPGFDVFVKRNIGGKRQFVEIDGKTTSLSRRDALTFGEHVVDNALEKSVVLKPSNKPVVPLKGLSPLDYKFRLSKSKASQKTPVYVEKNEFGLDSPGEVKKIQAYKIAAEYRKKYIGTKRANKKTGSIGFNMKQTKRS